MKEELITKAYEVAKERYAAIGVDVDAVIKQMQDFHLSLHCWQADDVMGFEKQAGPLTCTQYRRVAPGHTQGLLAHSRHTPPEPARNIRRFPGQDSRPQRG